MLWQISLIIIKTMTKSRKFDVLNIIENISSSPFQKST